MCSNNNKLYRIWYHWSCTIADTSNNGWVSMKTRPTFIINALSTEKDSHKWLEFKSRWKIQRQNLCSIISLPKPEKAKGKKSIYLFHLNSECYIICINPDNAALFRNTWLTFDFSFVHNWNFQWIHVRLRG